MPRVLKWKWQKPVSSWKTRVCSGESIQCYSVHQLLPDSGPNEDPKMWNSDPGPPTRLLIKVLNGLTLLNKYISLIFYLFLLYWSTVDWPFFFYWVSFYLNFNKTSYQRAQCGSPEMQRSICPSLAPRWCYLQGSEFVLCLWGPESPSLLQASRNSSKQPELGVQISLQQGHTLSCSVDPRHKVLPGSAGPSTATKCWPDSWGHHRSTPTATHVASW